MRIAFFTDVFPRLSNTFVVNQITGLLDRGHEVEIFARSEGDFTRVHDDVRDYRLQERMHHLRVPRNGFVRVGKAMALLSTRYAWHRSVLSALRPGNDGLDAAPLVNLYSVLSFIRRGRYDVVHCQFGKLAPPLLPLHASGRLAGKLVTSFRGADISRLPERRRASYRHLFRLGDLFLPVSDNFARQLVEAGCDPRRIAVHHSGIRCELFPFRERARRPGERTRVLFIGRLVEKKGVAYALEAVASLLASGREVELTIIGNGELRPDLERRARELGLAPAVTFVGDCLHGEVIDHLQRSHLLVAPSTTASDGDQEGIPNVLKEAMATGIPVVATRHSGIPELVEDGVSGYLVPERDSRALAAALLRLVDRPADWPRMGRAGRAKVEEEFDSSRLNDELVELYRSPVPAVSRPAPAAAAAG